MLVMVEFDYRREVGLPGSLPAGMRRSPGWAAAADASGYFLAEVASPCALLAELAQCADIENLRATPVAGGVSGRP